jgi:hypothetical protein
MKQVRDNAESLGCNRTLPGAPEPRRGKAGGAGCCKRSPEGDGWCRPDLGGTAVLYTLSPNTGHVVVEPEASFSPLPGTPDVGVSVSQSNTGTSARPLRSSNHRGRNVEATLQAQQIHGDAEGKCGPHDKEREIVILYQGPCGEVKPLHHALCGIDISPRGRMVFTRCWFGELLPRCRSDLL